jgi:cAMP-dependent protein kinase regulator
VSWPSIRFKKQKERAQKLTQDGDVAGALAVYQAIVADDPQELACLTRVAELSRQLGHKAEAVAAYARVAERLAEDGFLFKAAALVRQILELDPGHTQTQARLAAMYGAAPTTSGPLRIPPAATTKTTSRPKRRPDGEGTQSTRLADLVTDPIRPSAPPGPHGPTAPSLPRTPLFSELPEAALRDALSGLSARTVAPEQAIIAEGEVGQSFFVLASGRVRVTKETPAGALVLATLSEGAFFGEMALLQHGPRTASVIAESACEVLELDRALLEDLTARHPTVAKVLQRFYQQRLLGTATATHPFFHPFTPGERRQLADRFQARAFAEGEVVIAEGKKGDGLYLLLSGALVVSVGAERRVVATLGPGEIVGEMSLLDDRPTSAEVRAGAASWVLRLGRTGFSAVVSQRPEVLGVLQRVAEERRDGRPSAPPTTDDVLV